MTCFVTPQGLPAAERGARAIEGYPMITQLGQEITWGGLHVGSRSIKRRVVVRIDF